MRDQLVGVQLTSTRVLRDLLVHQRLCQCWRILLVVTQFTEADDIDHDILLELHAVVDRNLGREHNRFRIITVDVQHRRFDHLDDVRAIQSGARVAWIGSGETNLVVDHDVNRTAGTVTTCLCQIQGFHDHALTSECGVTVDQDRQHLRTILVTATLHTCLDRTFHHRVDDFQMGWVERQ